jgi:hypothetical protein
MVPAMLDDKYVIRFCVNAKNASDNDILAAWELIKSNADIILKQSETAEAAIAEEEPLALPAQITSKLKRLRFGISKMVSDPRSYNQKKYKRTATTLRFSESGGKYLARKCSIVEKDEDEA